MTATGDLLVIGYGNTLRRDDGVGQKVAEAVAALNLPCVSVLACQQLVPELAEAISQAGGALFVDAAIDADGTAELQEIEARSAEPILAHATDPRALLALAGQVFGHCPCAWSLTISVGDLSFGDGLSPRAEAGLRTAVEQTKELAKRLRKG